MAAVDIVFDDDGTLIPLVLDAVPSEQHRGGALATEDEVERGASISDHVRATGRTLAIEVVISDTPIASTDALEVVETTVSAAGQQITGFVPTSAPTRVLDSWAVLQDALARGLLATIVTTYETYGNMAFLDVVINRTAADGTWLRAELSFRELRIVSTEFVDDPVTDRPRDKRQKDQGSKQPTDATAQQQSLLSQLATAGDVDVGGVTKNVLGLF